MKVRLIWDKENFFAKTESGATYKFDEHQPKPMELILIALAGCTTIDITEILQKMKQNFEKIELEVEGKRAEDFPRRYKHIKVIYKVYGKGLEKEKVLKAIELSKNKYCSVMASLNSQIEYELEIIETNQ
jgi:putative redox protein